MSTPFRTVVLTGATSGIGEATALRFAGSATTLILLGIESLCPGLNDTPLSAAMMGRIGGPASHGAELVVAASTAAVPSTGYFEGGQAVSPSPDVFDPGNRARLTVLFRERLTPFVEHERIRVGP